MESISYSFDEIAALLGLSVFGFGMLGLIIRHGGER